MTLEQPPRLKDGELGPLLRAARDEMSPERLERNGARIKELIAAGSTFAAWKLLILLGLIGALAVPLAVRWSREDHTASVGHGTAIDALPALPPDAEIAQLELDAAVAAVEPPPAPALPVRHAHAAASPVVAAPIDAGPPPPPPSDLPAQLELYQAARTAAAAGDFATAIARIDELFEKFPSTQLRADAELTRAELLARAGRVADAIAAFDRLVADEGHRGRRGELLRTLGDLLRRSGDCARAIQAYDRALAEKLSERDRGDVRAGRDRCTKK